MQLKKSVIRLLVLAACAALASGCAMQATNNGEDTAAKTENTQAATAESATSTGSSAGSTGAQGGVAGSTGFTEQAVGDSGTASGSMTESGAMTDSGASASAGAEGAQISSLMRIHFDFDRYELSEEARMTLANNAAYLKANPNTRIRIEGHCDERGSDEYNLALGERRAMAAKRYLQSLGVDTSRLTMISYGEERPLDPSSSEAAWAKNRRAEFISR